VSNYPAIADPTTDPASLREAVMALKETVEILTRQRGAGAAAAVTWAELEALGGPVLLDRLAELGTSISNSTDTITTGYQEGDQALQDQLDGIQFASTGEAQAGTNTTKYMNPALTALAIAAFASLKQFAHYREEQPDGTNGGNPPTGTSAFNLRTLNTTVIDTIGASRSANQITLPAGTYFCFAISPTFRTGRCFARLYNVTDGGTILRSGGVYNVPGTNAETVQNFVIGVFTINATKTVQLEQFITNNPGSGVAMGQALSVGETEIYSELFFWKLS